MQAIPKTIQKANPAGTGQRAEITSEDEFERWLIAALEWERQRIETGEPARSSPGGPGAAQAPA
jgi:hypothetical protein